MYKHIHYYVVKKFGKNQISIPREWINKCESVTIESSVVLERNVIDEKETRNTTVI